jgi:sugar/nucleoside kinase (ribokinase family)
VIAVVAGHICIDLMPELPGAPCVETGRLAAVGPMVLRPGGSVANTGLGLAQLGLRTRLAADVGADELGAVLVGMLGGPNVDASGVRQLPCGATSYSVVVQPPGADRTFWHHVGTNATFDGVAVDLHGADLLHVGYPPILPALAASGAAGLLALLERAGAAGLTTSVDLADMDPASPAAAEDWHAVLARTLPHVGVFAPSVDDLASVLGGDAARTPAAVAALGRHLLRLGAAVVLLKAGPSGLYLGTADGERLAHGGAVLAASGPEWACRELWAPSMQVEVVGTTGAGDAAIAGLLFALSDGDGPEDALALAAATAAVRVSTTTPLPAAGALRARLAGDLRFEPFPEPGWAGDPSGIAHGPSDMTMTDARGAR